MRRGDYYRRLLEAYVFRAQSHLDFWRDIPEENPRADFHALGGYYLTYRSKASYPGPFDAAGIPLLNYRGAIGRQYNPIAVAQYGLAQFNRFRTTADAAARERFIRMADWLASHLEQNRAGIAVWQHHFEWPYRSGLKPPWASALAQGQGISLLVRADELTGEARYRDAARRALAAFLRPVAQGGLVVESDDELWLEEYPVDPPSHILNGAIAASWGLYDYWIHTREAIAKRLFERSVQTLAGHLQQYDTGRWSLYELPTNGTPMPASLGYHRLHVVQLRILGKMTGNALFETTADRWASYLRRPAYRTRAWIEKVLFKVRHY